MYEQGIVTGDLNGEGRGGIKGSKGSWVTLVFVLSHWAEENSSDLTWRRREVEGLKGDLKKHWLEMPVRYINGCVHLYRRVF